MHRLIAQREALRQHGVMYSVVCLTCMNTSGIKQLSFSFAFSKAALPCSDGKAHHIRRAEYS